MSEIICRDLTLGYENSILVRGLDFETNPGDYLCIVGENGAGKSTLMRTILRLQKPLSGEIIYGDGLTPSEIGYLPQQTLVQRDFPASVREVVLSGRQAKLGRHAFYSTEDKRCAEENMERLGIADLAKRCYRELSGGQQQRVLLARALCATSRMILLDEPVSGGYHGDVSDNQQAEQRGDLGGDDIPRYQVLGGICVSYAAYRIGDFLRYCGRVQEVPGRKDISGKRRQR